MTLTASKMVPLESTAPDFKLLDTVSHKYLSLETLKSERATVIMFICNHCPYVKHVLSEIVNIAKEYGRKDIHFIAINANDTEAFPEDSPEKMKQKAEEFKFSFPYLFDETQEVAKAYSAACTPDFFVYDTNLKCVYRGQLDDSRPGNNIPVTGKDLRSALDAVLSGKSPDSAQKPSMGCNIKWK